MSLSVETVTIPATNPESSIREPLPLSSLRILPRPVVVYIIGSALRYAIHENNGKLA
jgi:hypothetical protein